MSEQILKLKAKISPPDSHHQTGSVQAAASYIDIKNISPMVANYISASHVDMRDISKIGMNIIASSHRCKESSHIGDIAPLAKFPQDVLLHVLPHATAD